MSLISNGLKGGWPSHQHLLSLAIPMIAANVTTPLVGLVDTAVLGRMDMPNSLAGVSIATLIITQIVWICGFLRMSSTGRSAQAYGEQNQKLSAKIFWQGLFLSMSLGFLLLILQVPLFRLAVLLSNFDNKTAEATNAYFFIRIWGLPFALANLVCIGWMVGQQLTKTVLVIQVIGNCINVVLNIALVYGFDLGIRGVAMATVFSECLMFSMGLKACLDKINFHGPKIQWFQRGELTSIVSINSHIFIRNLTLQLCLAFVTFQGARYGVIAAGMNAIIMQFFAFIALGLDGIAYAVEALVGQAKGEKNDDKLRQHIIQGLIWSSMIAICYSVVFLFFYQQITLLLTHYIDIINLISEHNWLLVLLPVIGHWCFLFDGVAIGLTRAAAMRNTMLISAAIGFFPVWYLTQSLGNISLWLAMLSFLAMRGISLGIIFFRDYG